MIINYSVNLYSIKLDFNKLLSLHTLFSKIKNYVKTVRSISDLEIVYLLLRCRHYVSELGIT